MAYGERVSSKQAMPSNKQHLLGRGGPYNILVGTMHMHNLFNILYLLRHTSTSQIKYSTAAHMT
jgi:hypothetical protein